MLDMPLPIRVVRLLSASAVLACGIWSTEPPDRPRELRGTVTTVEPLIVQTSPPVTGFWILVEEDPTIQLDPFSPKAYFFVDHAKTRILAFNPDGGWSELQPDSLATGMIVDGWYVEDELVISTYPGRGTASDIVVVQR